MSWAKIGLLCAFAAVAVGGSACTAITLAEWSGYSEAPDGGSTTNPDGSSGPQSGCPNGGTLGKISACGKCMADNCGSYIGLACQIDSGSPGFTWVDDTLLPCAKNTDVQGYDCNFFTQAPDASISSAGDPNALENNVQVCLKSNCYDACRTCNLTYTGCKGAQVTVGPDSPCGTCIASACQKTLANCCTDIDIDPIAACSRTSTTCNGNGSCASLKAYAVDAGFMSMCSQTSYQCIVQNCASSCPN